HPNSPPGTPRRCSSQSHFDGQTRTSLTPHSPQSAHEAVCHSLHSPHSPPSCSRERIPLERGDIPPLSCCLQIDHYRKQTPLPSPTNGDVFDDEGNDVTPRPLFHPDPKTAASKQSKLLASTDHSGATGSVSLPVSVHQSSGEDDGFVAPHSMTCGSSTISESTMSVAESTLDGIKKTCLLTSCNMSDVQVRQEEIKEQLTEEDLDKRVDIYLTETETLWMLDLSPLLMSVESEDARNKIYAEVCKNRPGNDRFVERMMQTVNGAAKNKKIQCDKIIMEDKGIVVTSWDFYNSCNASQVEPTSEAEGSGAPDEKRSTSSMTEEAHQEEKCHTEATLRSENFQQNLFFMERILMENIFQPQLAVYRQIPVLIEHDKEKMDKEEQKETLTDPSILSELNETSEDMVSPSLEQLWCYRCDLTHQHNVSSMAWSKVNLDLLAVGYGAFDFKEQKEGLACCWSLKNPMWPERTFQCEHDVTTLDFSMAIPNLLAVGMYSGIIVVYNVQSSDSTTVFHSGECPAKHTGPVWQLKWVQCDVGKGIKRERLISISADGRITQWLIQEGLGGIDLMKIKRTRKKKKNLPSEKERESETPISQWAAGMCFDFHPKDTYLYLAGTEEGLIHKCSRSFNKQFLKTYRGHKGPVYKVAWNPFITDMFLSCSADWSVILWHQNSQTPILTFTSTTTVVHDIMWSPKSTFIFAAASESKVEIWDLSISILHPAITRFANPEAKFTSVLFAKNTDCLLMGDSRGEVGVFELQNLAASSCTEV
uniref:Dynein axonemal intermediate chain 4 n=1 Tax=Coturnix japonica TaxID=93934 RepID=A0A8C2TS38_COTJA